MNGKIFPVAALLFREGEPGRLAGRGGAANKKRMLATRRFRHGNMFMGLSPGIDDLRLPRTASRIS